MEIYREIKGFENYEISNLGNVRNLITNRNIKKHINGQGYYAVNLKNDLKIRPVRIHRLIAIAFIVNPDNKPCVDHIDNNTLNNNINNLRWATTSENGMNQKMSIKNTSGVKGVRYDKDRKKWKAEIKLNGINMHIGRYETIEEATRARQIKADELFGVFTNSCEKF